MGSFKFLILNLFDIKFLKYAEQEISSIINDPDFILNNIFLKSDSSKKWILFKYLNFLIFLIFFFI